MNTNTIKKIVTDKEATKALLAFQRNLEENNGLLLDGYEEVNHSLPVKSKLSRIFGGMSDRVGGVAFAGAVGMMFILATKFI